MTLIIKFAVKIISYLTDYLYFPNKLKYYIPPSKIDKVFKVSKKLYGLSKRFVQNETAKWWYNVVYLLFNNLVDKPLSHTIKLI